MCVSRVHERPIDLASPMNSTIRAVHLDIGEPMNFTSIICQLWQWTYRGMALLWRLSPPINLERFGELTLGIVVRVFAHVRKQ